MHRKSILSKIFIACLLIFGLTACNEFTPKQETISYLVDEANVISNENKKTLIRKLNDNKTIVPIFIRILKDVPNSNIEQYSNQKFNKIGIEKNGRGALIVLVMSTKQSRLEIGRGLEGEIPDMIASEILDNSKKHFSKGNFNTGLNSAIDSIYSHLTKGKH